MRTFLHVNSLSERGRAALRTAELLRQAAEIARQQAELAMQRAEVTRAVAASEQEEAEHTRDPNHAAPRAMRVKLLEDEARVITAEAETLRREASRLLSQARTAEQRGRLEE
jgi:hypothetical protein